MEAQFLVPRASLIVYDIVNEDRQTRSGNYIEHSNLKKQKDGTFEPGAYKALSKQQIKDLLLTMLDNKIPKPKHLYGLIPNQVFYTDNEKVVWYRESQPTDLFFSKNHALKSGKYALPPLVFVAYKQSLSVFAIKSTKDIDEKTKLYQAPLWNMTSPNSGSTCLGSTKRPEKANNMKEYIQMWEDYFFQSTFTHLNSGTTKDNINEVYSKLIDKTEFPLEQLIDTKITIKNIIQ
jgi:PRTRC genetic system protein B